MYALKLVALFVLLSLPLFSDTNSRHNMEFSFFQPSKEVFIKNAKTNYISNEFLKKSYSDPETPSEKFILAVAMDYIYEDGSEKTYNLYKTSAMRAEKVFNYITMPVYADFLVRTNRFDALKQIVPKMCGRDYYRCYYYKVVGKHLSGEKVTELDCQEANKFSQMRRSLQLICK